MSLTVNLINGISKKISQALKSKYEQLGLNWFQVRRMKNLPVIGLHTVKIFERPIQFYNRIEFLNTIDEIFIKESYKAPFSTSSPYIIDCGSNIGLSIIYFKKTFPEARILAFEPDDRNFELLSKNLGAFDFTGKNVEIRKQAVWVANTKLNFVEEGSMSSRIDKTGDNFTQSQSQKKEIEAIRLKDIITSRVDLLKVDIEGAEYEVLFDIEDKLKLVDRLFFEYHGLFEENWKLEQLLQLLSRQQFKYYIEAGPIYLTPFNRKTKNGIFDVQLNIYAFRD